MAGSIGDLKRELERTIQALEFFKDFTGAMNYAALKLLFESKPAGWELNVAVRDITGTFYRGRIESIRRGGGSFAVLCDDGELVSGVTAESVIAVRAVARP